MEPSSLVFCPLVKALPSIKSTVPLTSSIFFFARQFVVWRLLCPTLAAMAQSSLSCSRLDDSFGPHAGECRGGFDFTLLFEETILNLLPAGLLLVALTPRVLYLLRRAKKVASGNRSTASSAVKVVRTYPCSLVLSLSAARGENLLTAASRI